MLIFYIFVSFLIVATGSLTKVCTPGHYYYDGCNTCTCMQGGGGYACTKIGCVDNPVVCYIPSAPPSRKCVNGHSYNDGCNNCKCVNGAYSCTEMFCQNNPVVCYVK